MKDRSWIIVPGWPKFQHYGTLRRPTWIKNYIELLHKDDYLDLPLAARGMLHGIWLAYADREGHLRRSDLPAALLARARDAHLDSLNQVGLIEYSEKKPLPLTLERAHAHAHARGNQERGIEKARNWIQNGAAREVPAERLADVFADEYHIEDPATVQELVAQAQEFC